MRERIAQTIFDIYADNIPDSFDDMEWREQFSTDILMALAPFVPNAMSDCCVFEADNGYYDAEHSVENDDISIITTLTINGSNVKIKVEIMNEQEFYYNV